MKHFILILIVSLILLSCSEDSKNKAIEKQNQVIELLGAGATFPFPYYSKLFDVYYKENNVKVNYQAIGSGGGIRQMLSKTVDFGGTDAFMNADELAKTNNSILHIPTCLGAVAITYNLPNSPELKFNAEIIANIFLGKITKWNDKKIKNINQGIQIPDLDIVVVHRSDGSGTTFIFSDYMSKVSSQWLNKVGRGKSLNWPIGLGGKGNQGVAGLIQQTPGAIGYAEMIYAVSNDMPTGIIQNKSGNFIKPSMNSVSLAANVDLPNDMRVSLTDTDSPEGYPIAGFTWLIIYNELNYGNRSIEEAKEIMNLFWWAIHDGQKYAAPLHYASLPEEAVKKAEKLLESIKYKGKPIL